MFKKNSIIDRNIMLKILFISFFAISLSLFHKPLEAEASNLYVDGNGEISWNTSASLNPGPKFFRTIGWTFRVTNTSNGSWGDVYIGTIPLDAELRNETVGGVEWYTISAKRLVERAGISLNGNITIVANARVTFYESYILRATADDQASANVHAANLGFTGRFGTTYTGYYNRTIQWNAYYLEVRAGTGVASTTGTGWYAPGTNTIYGGTPQSGYTWGTSNRPGSIIMDSNKVITLTAQKTTYTVRYNGNGSTSGTLTDQKPEYDQKFNLRKNGYKKTGYTFTGWNTKKDGSGTSYAEGKKVKNLTVKDGGTVILYAQWKANSYTVIYDGNGATSGSLADHKPKYNQEFNLRKNGYKKSGYIFTGWNTKANGSGTAYAEGKNVKNLTQKNGETVTLYAQWKPNTYTVAFNGNGNTGGSADNQTMTYGTPAKLRANGFTRTGYTFSGWSTTASGAKVYNDEQSVSNLTATNGATVTLYAKWTPITYTIKYDPNKPTKASSDVTGSTANSSHTYNTAKALTPNGYSLTGWTFKGWNTNPNGTGTNYTNSQSVTNLTAIKGATVTLYAQWTPNKYIVHFEPNPENSIGVVSGSMSSVEMTYDTDTPLPKNEYTKTTQVLS